MTKRVGLIALRETQQDFSKALKKDLDLSNTAQSDRVQVLQQDA